MKLNAVDKDGHKWSFTKDFEIKDDVKKYNKEAVEINERVNKNDYIIYTLIFILTLAIGVIAYLLINLKKNIR